MARQNIILSFYCCIFSNIPKIALGYFWDILSTDFCTVLRITGYGEPYAVAPARSGLKYVRTQNSFKTLCIMLIIH